jgi:hypothetical protein
MAFVRNIAIPLAGAFRLVEDRPLYWVFFGSSGKENMETIRTTSQKVYISQKKGVYMCYDLNQDDSISFQFVISMAMTTFPFNLDFRHE